MIHSLQITGFRQFEKLSIEGLTRVNLFVGKNNAGKTSVLEAIEIFAGRGNPIIVGSAGLRRREIHVSTAPDEKLINEVEVLRNFRGDRPVPGAAFEIASDGGAVRVEFVDGGTFRYLDVRSDALVTHLPLSSDAGLPFDDIRANRVNGSRVLFVDRSWSSMPVPMNFWEAVQLTEDEEQVYVLLRTVDPRVQRVAATGAGTTPGFRVLLRGASAPIPLGTLGEAVRLLFILGLFLANARGGVLLIDEVGEGLHYSVMQKVWQFLIESARRLDVQVFATTHSLDCIQSLAYVAEEHPDLASDVSVHQLHAGFDHASVFNARDLQISVRHDMELR